MKRIWILVIAGTLFLNACGATENEGIDIEAHDPWARAGLKDENGAAYLLLHNHTKINDELVGVSSEAANIIELQLSHMNANDVMEMTQQKSIALPADGEVELKPGNYHIMLIGLKQDLKAGDEITLTLHFLRHEDITLTVPILDAADMGGSGMDGHTH